MFQISRFLDFKNPPLGLSRLKGAEDTFETLRISACPWGKGMAMESYPVPPPPPPCLPLFLNLRFENIESSQLSFDYR